MRPSQRVRRGARNQWQSGWARRLVTTVVAATTIAAAAVLVAPPAGAVTPGSGPLMGGVETVAGTVNSVTGGTATYDNTTPGTTTLTVSGPRTIIGFTSLNLAATDTLDIVVNSATDIVLLRVQSGTATIDGVLRSRLGSTVGAFGGNVWPFAQGGVLLNANARVDVGGLVASSAAITDADFLDGDAGFALANAGNGVVAQGAGTSAGPGALIRGHGSLVALIGSRVFSGHQARFEAAPGTRTEAFFGSAHNAAMTLAPRDQGMDLLRFQPGGSRSDSLSVWGPITAADVFVAANPAGRADTYTTNVHTVTANGAAADGDGDVVVSAGGGLDRPSATAPMQPVLDTTAPANIAGPGAAMTAARTILFSASDRLEVSYGTALAAPTVVVSTRGTFRNLQGGPTISPSTGRWVVYAPRPEDVLHPNASLPGYGTLNSGQRAVWGGTLESRPPSSVTGNRYVFSNPPDVTVTALNTSKIFDEAFAAELPHQLQATVTGEPHAGIPNVFLPDTGPAFVGQPTLTSDGRPHTAPERPGGYPIVPSAGPAGQFYSPLGYDLVFVNGTLTVEDQTAPTVTPTLTGTTPGDNGWYRSDMTLSWAVTDIGTISTSITRGPGCATQTFTADVDTSVTCLGGSLGGTTEVTQEVKRDASAPGLTIDGLLYPSGGTYTAGTWTNQDVEVIYTCAGAVSGVASMTVNKWSADRMTESGDADGWCTDNAGNSTSVPFRVNIDKELPTLGDEVLRIAGTETAYTEGSWVNQDVELTWTCADTGGSGVTATGSATATGSGTLQAVCRDGAGNETRGLSFDVSIDEAAPTTGLTLTKADGTPYVPGTWSRLPVTVTVTCADTGGSGATTDGFSTTLTETGSATFHCRDDAGNATAVPTGTVQIDGTAPAIGGLSLTTADGIGYTSGAWTAQPVTLAWTCTDGAGGSGAVESSGSATATSTGTLQAVCADAAGNRAEGDLIQANIDDAAPVLAGVPTGLSATTTGDTATVTWLAPTATDDQDGAVDIACTPASGSSFPVGATTVTCTATDDAGNRDTRTFTVTVTRQTPMATVTFDKPIDSAPVMNIAKLGRAIAVRATVTSGGTPVTGTSTQPVYLSVTSGLSCSVASTTDTIENYAAGSSGTGNLMKWDVTAQRWTFLLDTGAFAMKANACYRVSVHYGGTVTGGIGSGGTLVGSFYVQTKK